MNAGLAIAVLLALGFAVTNGIHDASNAIATLVATRAARPSQAIILATVFNLLGPLLIGAAVADTIGGIVTAANGVHGGLEESNPTVTPIRGELAFPASGRQGWVERTNPCASVAAVLSCPAARLSYRSRPGY